MIRLVRSQVHHSFAVLIQDKQGMYTPQVSSTPGIISFPNSGDPQGRCLRVELAQQVLQLLHILRERCTRSARCEFCISIIQVFHRQPANPRISQGQKAGE